MDHPGLGGPVTLAVRKKDASASVDAKEMKELDLCSPPFFFFLVFRATLVASGGSQARGRMGTVAASLHHRQQQCQI